MIEDLMIVFFFGTALVGLLAGIVLVVLALRNNK